MTIDIEKIKTLSLLEEKTTYQRFLKLSEECGELAEAIQIRNAASGFDHKEKIEGAILEECVDILLVAYSIFFKEGGNEDKLKALLEQKCIKWEKHQRRSKKV